MDYRSGTMFRITVRIWGSKYEAGTLDENAQAADPPKKYETKIATLVRLVGRQAREIEFLKRALKRPTAEKRDYVSHFRAFDLSIACGMSADGSAPDPPSPTCRHPTQGYRNRGPHAGVLRRI
jgi:hypothetical protein